MHQEEPIKKDHYKSLSTAGEGLYKEKGSKFLAFAYPLKNEEEVKEKLEELRKQFHDARHYCYAYRLNPEQPEWRANDDGEPSNSAGMPIYNQLLSAELWNVLVVVVRYFGGTKLGVSGLVNAYREAAKLALSDAKVSEEFLISNFSITFPYTLTNEVMRLIKDEELIIHGENMGIKASYTLGVRKGNFEKVMAKFEALHQLKLTQL